jgi:hypothetical protein
MALTGQTYNIYIRLAFICILHLYALVKEEKRDNDEKEMRCAKGLKSA